MSTEILISGGNGPSEARWFAMALGGVVAERFAEVLGWRAGPSLGLDVEPSALAGWIGTHELVWRTGPGRKRWFVGLSVFAPPPVVPVLDPRDVLLTATRAGGPGGQCVNTTSSAVLARHLPTGLVVRVQDERSQHANRRVALERLAAALAATARATETVRDRQRWLVHHTVQRGSPVVRWVRDPQGGLVEAPAHSSGRRGADRL